MSETMKETMRASFVHIKQTRRARCKPKQLNAELCAKAHIRLPNINLTLLLTSVSHCVFVITLTLSRCVREAYILSRGGMGANARALKSPGLPRANSPCRISGWDHPSRVNS